MMSFWNVLLSILSAVCLSLIYGIGFEIGYSEVMNGRLLAGMK
jgi:predicted membrane protein